jgi:hypothetical protein
MRAGIDHHSSFQTQLPHRCCGVVRDCALAERETNSFTQTLANTLPLSNPDSFTIAHCFANPYTYSNAFAVSQSDSFTVPRPLALSNSFALTDSHANSVALTDSFPIPDSFAFPLTNNHG